MGIREVVDDVRKIDRWAYERAMQLLDAGGARSTAVVDWARDTEEQLRGLANELESKYPAEHQQLAKRISESLLDLQYLQADGVMSLRVGREWVHRRDAERARAARGTHGAS